MPRPLLALVLLLFYIDAATAELGPKDGRELSPTDLERVTVGTPAPDFTLEASDSRRISLAQFRGNKNVVLVFYRGHW